MGFRVVSHGFRPSSLYDQALAGQHSALVMACAARVNAGAADSWPGFGRCRGKMSEEVAIFSTVRAYREQIRSFPDAGLRTGRAGSFIGGRV